MVPIAASTSGAVKALIETLGLSLSAYRDRPPEDTAKPYVTIQEGIAITPDLSGDNGQNPTVRETVQVSLWQASRSAANLVTESYTLADSLYLGLHGARLSAAPKRVYGCKVRSSVRLLERDASTVQTVYTLELSRVL